MKRVSSLGFGVLSMKNRCIELCYQGLFKVKFSTPIGRKGELNVKKGGGFACVFGDGG